MAHVNWLALEASSQAGSSGSKDPLARPHVVGQQGCSRSTSTRFTTWAAIGLVLCSQHVDLDPGQLPFTKIQLNAVVSQGCGCPLSTWCCEQALSHMVALIGSSHKCGQHHAVLQAMSMRICAAVRLMGPCTHKAAGSASSKQEQWKANSQQL